MREAAQPGYLMTAWTLVVGTKRDDESLSFGNIVAFKYDSRLSLRESVASGLVGSPFSNKLYPSFRGAKGDDKALSAT